MELALKSSDTQVSAELLRAHSYRDYLAVLLTEQLECCGGSNIDCVLAQVTNALSCLDLGKEPKW